MLAVWRVYKLMDLVLVTVAADWQAWNVAAGNVDKRPLSVSYWVGWDADAAVGLVY